MIVLFSLLGALALFGGLTEEIHKKMRLIIRNNGYKFGFYIGFQDYKLFMKEEKDNNERRKFKALAKKMIFYAISAAITIIIFISYTIYFTPITWSL